MCSDFLWCDLRLKSGNHGAIFIHQELGEVPSDIRLAVWRCSVGFEPLEEGATAIAIDLYFGEEREVDLIFAGRKLIYFFISAGFLSTELITGEAQYLQIIPGVLKRTQTCVLWCQASLTCQVDNQQGLVPVIGKGYVITAN